MMWECLCLEINCKASMWKLLALPVARGSDVYINTVSMVLWNTTSEVVEA